MSAVFIPCAIGNNSFADIEVKPYGDLIMIGTITYTREDARALADALLALTSQKSQRTRPMTPTHVCPHCKCAVGRYDFMTADDVLVTAWHCNECDRDVVPILSEVLNQGDKPGNSNG